MIKFALRPNLIYPLLLIIWSFSRNLERVLINEVFKFKGVLIYISLMFIGEFLSGLILYLYQKRYLYNKAIKPSKFMAITLIKKKKQ